MSIPADLQQLRAWLVWGLPNATTRKQPYYASGAPRTGRNGSIEDRAKLVTNAEARTAKANLKAEGVGIALLPENNLVALDFDGCVDEGTVRPEVLALVQGTYAEISPSGNGVRAFFKGVTAAGSDNKTPEEKQAGEFGFEVFTDTKYVTVTGKQIPGTPDTLAELPQSVRDYAAQRFGPKVEHAATVTASTAEVVELTPQQLADVAIVLQHPAVLAAASSNDWWSNAVGYPLKRHGLLELWLDFSRRAPNFNEGAPEQWWNSHQAGKSDFRHLLVEAERVGCPNPGAHVVEPARAEEFKIIAQPVGAAAAELVETRKALVFHRTPRDILTRHFPERPHAIYPYLPSRTVSLLLSVGGYGKSFLFLMMALCKALGLDFCGNTCTPGRVVLVSGEDDLDEMVRREHRVLRYLTDTRGLRIDFDLLETNFQIVDRAGCGAENMLTRAMGQHTIPTDLAKFFADQVGAADVIALDTMSQFDGGPENDNSAGAVLIAAGNTIATLTGAAVLMLGHTGKGVAREGIVDQYAPRGASSKSDNARSVMVLASVLEAQKKEFDLDVAAIERQDIFRLAHVKANYAKKAGDVFFRRTDGGVVAPFNPKKKRGASGDELTLKLLGHVGYDVISRGKLKREYKEIFGGEVNRETADAAFTQAVRDGLLVFDCKRGLTEYYRVSDRSLKASADAPMRDSLPPDEFCTKPDAVAGLI